MYYYVLSIKVIPFVKEKRPKKLILYSNWAHINLDDINLELCQKFCNNAHITCFIIQLTLIYTRSLSDDGLFGLLPGFEAFVDPRPQIGHLS